MDARVAVVVQAGPTERAQSAEVRADIEASDIGQSYELLLHPSGISVCEHLCACLRSAAARAELVLRLEDDVSVNRHILYNVSSWEAPADERFGVGWVFDPGAMTRGLCRSSDPRRQDLWCDHVLYYSQAIVIRSADVEWICEGVLDWQRHYAQSRGEQDLALCHAALRRRKQICVHAPSLVEHRVELGSLLGHVHEHAREATSCGSFSKTWRRDQVLKDRYGRHIDVW